MERSVVVTDKPVSKQIDGERTPVVEAAPGVAPGAKRVWILVSALSLLALASAAWVKGNQNASASVAEEKRPERPRPVKIVEVKLGALPLMAEYRGELDTNIAELAAQGSGRLLSVAVNLGDTFKAGQVLAKIDAAETRRLLAEASAQMESAAAAGARATAQLEASREEAERGRKLVEERVLSEQELSSLRSQVKIFEAEVSAAEAQKAAASSRAELYRGQLSEAELKAPFDGAVGQRYLDPGATVQPGTPVLRLVKGGPLEVRFGASEVHLARLSPGTPLSISTLGTGQRTYAGHLIRIAAEVSRVDRSVAAEGLLDAEYPELRPGMYASVKVSLGTLNDAIVVPSAALLSRIAEDGTSQRGIYVDDGGKARYVRLDVLGEHEGTAAVIGVTPGQKVVVQGQEVLSDGGAIEAVVEKKP